MGTSEEPVSTNRRLVFAMTIAAVTSAAVRLLRGNIDSGVLVQLDDFGVPPVTIANKPGNESEG